MAGLDDPRHGRETIASLLVAMGTQASQLGLEIPDDLSANPQRRFCDLLAQDDSDSAHSRYNAYLRRLITYERAAECVSP